MSPVTTAASFRSNERISLGQKLRMVLTLAGVALAFASCLAVAWLRFQSPYQFEYGEGVILNTALRWREGQPIYPPPANFTSPVSPYGPLGYAVGLAGVITQPPSLLAPRVVELLIALLTAVIISLLIGRFSRSWAMRLVFPALFICTPFVMHWASLLRVDFVGLLFSLAGVYFFTAEGRLRWLSCPLFMAAVLVKWSFLAAPAACFLYLISLRQSRRALRFSVVYAALVVACLAVAQWRTNGWFAWHMFRTHPDSFYLPWFVLLIKVVLLNVTVPVLIACSLPFLLRRCPDHRERLFKIYLLLTCLMIPAAGKVGANTNYFLEFAAVLAICAALGYRSVERDLQADASLLIGAALLAAAVISLHASAGLALGSSSKHAGCGAAYDFVRAVPGDQILTENVSALVLAQKPVLLSDPFMYRQLAKHGRLPESGLVAAVHAQRFQLILLGREVEDRGYEKFRWSDEFVAALYAHYRIARRFACEDANLAFIPKSGADMSDANDAAAK